MREEGKVVGVGGGRRGGRGRREGGGRRGGEG